MARLKQDFCDTLLFLSTVADIAGGLEVALSDFLSGKLESKARISAALKTHP